LALDRLLGARVERARPLFLEPCELLAGRLVDLLPGVGHAQEPTASPNAKDPAPARRDWRSGTARSAASSREPLTGRKDPESAQSRPDLVRIRPIGSAVAGGGASPPGRGCATRGMHAPSRARRAIAHAARPDG